MNEPWMSESSMAELLETASHGMAWSEVFAERTVSSAVVMEDGVVRTATTGVNRGIGIRTRSETGEGFAHTSDLTRSGLRAACSAALAASAGRPSGRLQLPSPAPFAAIASAPPSSRLPEMPLAALRAAHEAALGAGPAVRGVKIAYVDSLRDIHVTSTAGARTSDRQHRRWIMVESIAQQGGGQHVGTHTVGRTGPAAFDEPLGAEVGTIASRRALALCRAESPPVGEMPVVFSPEASGLFFHEAIGHALEAGPGCEGPLEQASIGRRVASPLLSIVDDATLPGAWGSAGVDDQGVPARRTVLVEGGVLRGFLAGGANGRRESYCHAPLTRMTNLAVMSQPTSAAEILRSTGRGIYCADASVGEVDPTGAFVFNSHECYRIEGGELAGPLRPVRISGSVHQALLAVDAVGDDALLTTLMCAKSGQELPVGGSQPTVRVARLVIEGDA